MRAYLHQLLHLNRGHDEFLLGALPARDFLDLVPGCGNFIQEIEDAEKRRKRWHPGSNL